MAKGELCQITNCKNLVTSHGRICGTHRWRKKNYNSYDRQDYFGIPNYLPENKLPEGIVNKCKVHGYISLEETYQRKYKDNIHYKCKKCVLSINIKNKYKGLNNLYDYEKMLLEQNGCCDMCKGQNNTTRNGKIKRFNIDHCHKTGKVRCLLYSFCNALLGYSKDSIEILESAIEYLKKHK